MQHMATRGRPPGPAIGLTAGRDLASLPLPPPATWSPSVTDTPESGPDAPPRRRRGSLDGATTAAAARRHRSHHHRRRGLRPLDIAGIVVAVLVVIGVAVVIAESHKSTKQRGRRPRPRSSPAPPAPTTKASAGVVTGPNATAWLYTGLNGQKVKVLKGTKGSARFVVYQGNAIPLTVAAVEKAAAKDDCASIQKIYVANKAANPSSTATSNNRRSAYANFALTQGKAKNCSWATAAPAG